MKIKNYGFSTYKIYGDKISVLTDPISLLEAGLTLPSVDCDVCIFSDENLLGKENVLKSAKLDKKVASSKRDDMYEIVNYGEFAIGDLFVRRPLKGGFYLIDEGYLRIVYMGLLSPDFDPATVKDLGDVDLLILPVGDAETFPSFQKLEKILSNIEPNYLIPSCYKVPGLSEKYSNLKSVDEFLKDYGVSNFEKLKELKITNAPEKDDKNMDVIVLES